MKDFSARLSVSTKAIALLCVHRVSATPLFMRHQSSIITACQLSGGSSSTSPPSLDFGEQLSFAYTIDSEEVTDNRTHAAPQYHYGEGQQRQEIQQPYILPYEVEHAFKRVTEERETTSSSSYRLRSIVTSFVSVIGSLLWRYRRVAMASLPSQSSLVGIGLLAVICSLYLFIPPPP
eukprot:CAMPEP_0185744926 /NCGR_PEP_ID=MMETSP1174-20130828/3197_1 /TAXON_ID=35687 /ORGANISM="Dictyocha speculum, Strain CCMP1381" /LENGTH=176 /DNA_ID=CAMNT_0028418643 /DNA_START=12 /DNA_END=538 /DNA_ORIENTATION=+